MLVLITSIPILKVTLLVEQSLHPGPPDSWLFIYHPPQKDKVMSLYPNFRDGRSHPRRASLATQWAGCLRRRSEQWADSFLKSPLLSALGNAGSLLPSGCLRNFIHSFDNLLSTNSMLGTSLGNRDARYWGREVMGATIPAPMAFIFWMLGRQTSYISKCRSHQMAQGCSSPSSR